MDLALLVGTYCTKPVMESAVYIKKNAEFYKNVSDYNCKVILHIKIQPISMYQANIPINPVVAI